MMIALALSSAVAATFSAVPDLDTLIETSTDIVRGEVIGTSTEWCASGLATRYVVSVDEALKGDIASTVSFLLPGGRQDGLVQRVSGVPMWEEGDAVLLFLPDHGQPLLTGVLTLVGDRPVDLLSRPFPSRFDAIAKRVRSASAPSVGPP